MTRINKVYPLAINKFEELQCINGVYDLVTILNQLICKLNKVGKLTNDVVYDWNNVMQWYLDNGTAGGGGGGSSDANLRADLASVQKSKGASLVGVNDSSNLYTATTVETALREVMIKVNNALDLATTGGQLREDLLSIAIGKGASIVGVNNATGLFSSTSVQNVLVDIMTKVNDMSVSSPDALKEELKSTAVGKGASMIGVNDVGNIITSTTVEGALQEVMTKANSAFQSANDGKVLLSSALAEKGQTVANDAPFVDFANGIKAIEQGGGGGTGDEVQMFSGTATSTGTTKVFTSNSGGNTPASNFLDFDFTEIPFIPETIVFYGDRDSSFTVWERANFFEITGGGTPSYGNCSKITTIYRIPYQATIVSIPVQSQNKEYKWTALSERMV